jgi:hypothetical protein
MADLRGFMGGFGVGCGLCGGSIYFETCGIGGCEFAIAGECQRCGERTPHTCPDHPATAARRPEDG